VSALNVTTALRARVPLSTVTATPGIACSGAGEAVLSEVKAHAAAGTMGEVAGTFPAALSTVMQRCIMVALAPGGPFTRQNGVTVWAPAASGMTAVTRRPS
jgi:hypothetical protein